MVKEHWGKEGSGCGYKSKTWGICMEILGWGVLWIFNYSSTVCILFPLYIMHFFSFFFFWDSLLSLGFNGLTMMWLGIVFLCLVCLRFTELLCLINSNFHQSLGKFCPLFLSIYFLLHSHSLLLLRLQLHSYCTIWILYLQVPEVLLFFPNFFSTSVLHIG